MVIDETDRNVERQETEVTVQSQQFKKFKKIQLRSKLSLSLILH